MTPKTSLNKTALNMFGFTLKKNLGFSIIASVLSVIVSPVYLYSVIADYMDRSQNLIYDFSELFANLSILAAIAVTAFFILLLYINFGYLYKKSASDFFHALPLKRSTLLLVRFLGSYISALIPLTVAYIGAFSLTALDYVSADISVMLKSYFFTAAMMLLLGLFTLVFILISGAVFDSITALISVNIGIPIIAMFIASLCESHLYGFIGGDYTDLFSYTTPFGYALLRLISANSDYYETETLFTLPRIIFTLFVIIALAALNVFIYNRRKSEKLGGSYAFKIVPEIVGIIISAIGCFIMAYIFSSRPEDFMFWIAGAVGAVLTSTVYFASINRGFKKIKNSVLIGIISFVMLIITNFGIMFDIFGWEYCLPEINDIATVSIRCYNEYIDVKNIDLAVELNKEIVKENNSYSGNGYIEYFTFEYKLKNGKTVERSYNVNQNVAVEQKNRIVNEELPRQIMEDYNEIKEKNIEDWSVSGYLYDNGGYIGDFELEIDSQTAEKLIYAYIDDLKTLGNEGYLIDYNGRHEKDGNSGGNVYVNGRTVVNKLTEVLSNGNVSEQYDYEEFSVYIRNFERFSKFKAELDCLDIKVNYEENK